MSLSPVVMPAGVLLVFALTVPVSLPEPSSDVAGVECMTFADKAPERRPDLTRILERCSELYPEDVELLADLGAQYELAGAAQQAEAAYQRALALDPGHAELRLRLGRLCIKRGAASDARRHAEAALQVQPNRQALLDLLREASRISSEAAR